MNKNEYCVSAGSLSAKWNNLIRDEGRSPTVMEASALKEMEIETHDRCRSNQQSADIKTQVKENTHKAKIFFVQHSYQNHQDLKTNNSNRKKKKKTTKK